MSRPARTALLLAALVLGGCGAPRADLKQLELVLESYASTLRWGRIDEALPFIDPAVLAADPPSSFELERWRQLRVAGYRAQPYVLEGTEAASVTVELELVNVNTQQARSTVDRQRWRYDAAAQRWWLVSGLPALD